MYPFLMNIPEKENHLSRKELEVSLVYTAVQDITTYCKKLPQNDYV